MLFTDVIEMRPLMCLDENLGDLFQKQIRKLVIGIDRNADDGSTMEYFCNFIFPIFNQLTELVFTETSYEIGDRLAFDAPSVRFTSSILTVLSIKVENFGLCLDILDGRFKHLHTLCIHAVRIQMGRNKIASQRMIPNLKWFALSCCWEIYQFEYDKSIYPLLNRMSNLEKLDLDLTILAEEQFLDGSYLKRNILHRMSKLNQLTFNIHSILFLKNQIDLRSEEEIAQTFEHFPNLKIVTRLNYLSKKKQVQCHVYSYPFVMQHYEDLTNHFPGGFYPFVRLLSLYDEQPFEDEFFLRISQSFPSIQKLSVINDQAQTYKDSCQSVKNEQSFTLIKYSHLVELDLKRVHDDYVEQFLCDRKTFFCNSVLLRINLQSLARVTHHFTRDSTRINCGKINEMVLVGKEDSSMKFLPGYFPSAKIRSFF